MSALRTRPSPDKAVRRRDLASPDLWDRSLRRSRERRRVAEIHRRTAPRRKGISLAVSAALLASPVFPRFASAHAGSGIGTPTEDTGGPAAPRAPELLERGDTGSAVEEAQRALGVTADGVFGPITEAAVKRFQGHEGLPRTGRVDPTTWMKLFSGNVTVVEAGTPEARAIQTAAGDEPTQPIPAASSSPAKGESGGPAAFQPAQEESGARASGGERREPQRTRQASTEDSDADRSPRRESAGADRDRPSGDPDRPSGDRDRPSGDRDRPSGDRDRPSGDRDGGATQPVSNGRDDSSSGGGGSCGNGDFARPVNGTVTGVFGEDRGGRSHEGIDIAAPSGTPIKAATCGRVSEAGSQGGYGNIICVRASESFTTCYAHLSRFGASVGQAVKIGEVIGYVGCTGSCTGPHVHFEVRIDGQQVDPAPYLNGSKKPPSARSSSTMAVRFTDSTRKTPAAKAAKREKVSRQHDEAAKDPAQQPQIATPAAGGEAADGTPTDQPAPTAPSTQDPAAAAPAPADPSTQAPPGQEVDPSAGAVEDTTAAVEETTAEDTTAPVEDTTGTESPGTDTSTTDTGAADETTASTEENTSSSAEDTTGTDTSTTDTGAADEQTDAPSDEDTSSTTEETSSSGEDTSSTTEETTSNGEDTTGSSGEQTDAPSAEDSGASSNEDSGSEASGNDTSGSEEPAGATAGG
ncbi:MAG: peptidoglycan DD-metalloendopeptidase family protein [Solirubrobacteraceae bacterium]